MTYTTRRRYYTSNPGSGIIGWLAIAAGGYILLKAMGIDILAGLGFGTTTSVPVTQGTTTNANNPPVTTNPTTNPNSSPTNSTAVNTKSLILSRVMQDGISGSTLMTADQWNFYYQLVRGIPGPAPEQLFPNNDRNRKYSIDEWWSAMSGGGFSGYEGMGVITSMNPYHQYNAPGRGYGLTPNGSEMFAKWVN